MENKPTRMDAVAEARAWLDTPFHHQASIKGAGCDCIGLIKGVGVALKLVDYDPASAQAQAFANYSMLPNSRRMREGLTHGLSNFPWPKQRWRTFTLWLGDANRSMSRSLPTKASFTAIPAWAKWSNMRWTIVGGSGSLPPTVSRILSRIHKWPF